MTEYSLPWDGTTLGDAVNAGAPAPYDAATEFANILRLISGSSFRANKGGVFRGELLELIPATSGGVSPVTVGTGAAIDYGTVYNNTTSVNVAIPTPAGSTRVDLIVLLKTWATQVVRITRIAGTEGAGAPSLVARQTAAVEWAIPIAQASITTGGVITLTDTREFVNILGSATPSKIKLDVAGNGGTSTNSAHADHIHEIDDPATPIAVNFGVVGVVGTGVNPAREDHTHTITTQLHRKHIAATKQGSALIDTELQCPLLAATYLFEGFVLYDNLAGAPTNLLFSISNPGGTFNVSVIGPSVADPTILTELNIVNTGTITFGIDAAIRSLHFRGTIESGAGLFGLILNAASGTPHLYINSHLMVVQE